MFSDQVRTAIELLAALGSIASVIVAGLAWVARSSFVTHSGLNLALEPIGSQLDDHQTRLADLEGRVEQMPSAQEWSRLTERLGRLDGGQAELGTKIDGLRRELKSDITGIQDVLTRIERPLNVLIDNKLKTQGDA